MGEQKIVFEVRLAKPSFQWVILRYLDMEQRITPWQDDSVVSQCPLCRNVYFWGEIRV